MLKIICYHIVQRKISVISLCAFILVISSFTLYGSPYSISNSLSQASAKDSLNRVIGHYWVNDSITGKITNSGLEPIFEKYIKLLQLLPTVEAQQNITLMASQVISNDNTLNLYWSLYEKYLYDPDSPYRDEDLYLGFLSYILKSHLYDMGGAYYQKALFHKEMINRNKKGKKAENFYFTSSGNKRSSLYDIRAEYIILLFYLPDCPECNRIKESLEQMDIDLNKVRIVCIYPGDNRDLWISSPKNQNWIDGYDKNQMIMQQSLYDLRAFPTLYLLDKNKKVIFKDITIDALHEYFSSKSLGSVHN